jgi:myo-inositol catabolism protein IolC
VPATDDQLSSVDGQQDAAMLAEQASPVDGFIGFAIGRSIWWDALMGFLDESLDRQAAASQIADNYLHFIQVYEKQAVH